MFPEVGKGINFVRTRMWGGSILMSCSVFLLGACSYGDDGREIPEDICGVSVDSRHIDAVLPESGSIKMVDGKPSGRFAAQCRVLTGNKITMHVSVVFDSGEMNAVAAARKPPYEFTSVRESKPGIAVGHGGAFASLECYSESNASTHLNGEISIYDEMHNEVEISDIAKFAEDYFGSLKAKVGCASSS